MKKFYHILTVHSNRNMNTGTQHGHDPSNRDTSIFKENPIKCYFLSMFGEAWSLNTTVADLPWQK